MTESNDPMVRQSRGDEYVLSGRLEEALDEYLCCFDHGLQYRSSYAGVRVSFLLESIVRLGEYLPRATKELITRRDAARRALLAGGEVPFDRIMDYIALDRTLGHTDGLKLFDELTKSGQADTRAQLGHHLAKELVDAGRYKDFLAASLGGKSLIQYHVAVYDIQARDFPIPGAEEEHRDLVGQFLEEARWFAEKHLEALLSCGRSNELASMLDVLKGRLVDGETYARLVRVAVRRKASEVARAIVAEAEQILPEEELSLVREAAQDI